MAEGVLFSIAEGIIANLASEPLKQLRLPFGVRDELRKLEATITTIKAVLLDAEEKKVNHEVRLWVDRLEDVLYDADNLFDEFLYQQLKRKVLCGKKKAKKVRIFFSSSNQLVFRLKMATKIKQIRETLDEINGNRIFHLDHLVSLFFKWNIPRDIRREAVGNIAAKEAFECLEPPQNIKAIQVKYYWGETFPNWLSLLHNLIKLELFACDECKYLPPLHHLSYLKKLKLYDLLALEYVSEWDNDWNRGDHPSTSSMSSTTSFFPSLTKLTIIECRNLQGWWGRERQDFDEAVEPYFPKLSELEIDSCHRLTSIPLFPNLEKLDLRCSSSKPLEGTMKSESSVAATSSAATSSSSSAALSKLKDLNIHQVDELESLPEEIRNLSSLQNLEISYCDNLTSFPEGICNLKSLQTLTILGCDNLISLPKEISNLQSLQNLEIFDCPKLTSLPEGISNLKSLQMLCISNCPKLTSLPEEIRSLPFLNYYA